MEDLLDKVMNQNFVPVLDNQKSFIGVITRKDVIQYLCHEKETEREKMIGRSGAGRRREPVKAVSVNY